MVRHVAAYFEPVTANPSGITTPAPMHIQSASLINDFWQLLWELLTTGEIVSPGNDIKEVRRLVSFDADGDGAEVWAVLVYGPGFQQDHVPNGFRDRARERLADPFVRTFVVDIGVNLFTVILGGNPFVEAEESIAELVAEMITFVVGLMDEETGMLEGNDEFGDVYIGLIFTEIFSKLTAVVQALGGTMDEGPWRSLVAGGGGILKWIVDFVSVLNRGIAGINFIGALAAVIGSNPVEFFTVSEGFGYIHPRNRVLPDAEYGCPYEATFEISPQFIQTNPGFSYNWEFNVEDYTATAQYPGWTVSTETDGKWARVATTEIVDADLAVYNDEVRVIALALSSPSGFSDSGLFTGAVVPPTLRITSVELLDTPEEGWAPGSTATVEVWAGACNDLGRFVTAGAGQAGAVQSEGLVGGGAPLTLGGDGVLTADVQFLEPLDDNTRVPIEVVVNGVNPMDPGDPLQATAYLLAEIAEVPPTIHPLDPIVLVPGETATVGYTISDPNFVGTNPGEVELSELDLGSWVTTDPHVWGFEFSFDHSPEAMVASYRADRSFTIALPHMDNDGTTGSEGDHAANAEQLDFFVWNDNAYDPVETTWPLTIRNIAPVITNATNTLVVTDGETAEVFISVADDNGTSDIGNLEIVGPSRGFEVTSSTVTEGQRVFWVEAAAVDLSGCDDACPIEFQALDADDLESNGGKSTIFALTLEETATDCASNEECGGDRYCWFNGGACDADERFCRDRPATCPSIDAEPTLVCGCDGAYYPSSCHSERLGVTPDVGDSSFVCSLATSSCLTSAQCGEDEMCLSPVGACGGGTCVVKPIDCSSGEAVCGCDGFTYDSPCDAMADGVNIVAEGACGGTCHSDDDCFSSHTCHRPVGGCFDEGTCVPLPLDCDDSSPQVCGCDGLGACRA